MPRELVLMRDRIKKKSQNKTQVKGGIDKGTADSDFFRLRDFTAISQETIISCFQALRYIRSCKKSIQWINRGACLGTRSSDR